MSGVDKKTPQKTAQHYLSHIGVFCSFSLICCHCAGPPPLRQRRFFHFPFPTVIFYWCLINHLQTRLSEGGRDRSHIKSHIVTREFHFGSFDEHRQKEERKKKNGCFQACGHGVGAARPGLQWSLQRTEASPVADEACTLLRTIHIKMLPFLHSAVSERPWEVMKQSK